MITTAINHGTFGQNPASAQPNTPPGNTKYTLKFKIEAGNTTTSEGTLSWTESNS